MNNVDAYDVIKVATLHRTSCDVVWRHKDVSTVPHCNTEENLLYTTLMQSVRFLVLYQTFPYKGSSGSRYDMYQTDFDLEMSEISNIGCKWVKTMAEILKPRGLHAHVNFVFGVCKLMFSCKKQTKGLKVELTAIIQLGVAQFQVTRNMYGKRGLGP